MNSFTQGQIIPLGGLIPPIRFQWNPREINGPTATSTYATMRVAGRQFPYIEYSNGEQSSIRFDLEYSTRSDNGSMVKANYLLLNSLTMPLTIGKTMQQPPMVMLILGNFLRERCVVTEVTPNFPRLFDRDTLLPLQAKISINMWRVPLTIFGMF